MQEHQVPLWKAIQSILYDIRGSPNDINGETPFFRLFGRAMPTKLSRMLESEGVTPTSRTRSPENEYKKRWSTIKAYDIGDQVLVRKGDGHPFKHLGVIARKVANFTYEVDFGTHCRKYNQRHIKPTVIEEDFNVEPAVEAYEAVEASLPATPVPDPPAVIAKPVPANRRNRKLVDRFGVVAY
jgi:hypothetical protein